MEIAKSSNMAHFFCLLGLFVHSSTRCRKISILRKELLGTVEDSFTSRSPSCVWLRYRDYTAVKPELSLLGIICLILGWNILLSALGWGGWEEEWSNLEEDKDRLENKIQCSCPAYSPLEAEAQMCIVYVWWPAWNELWPIAQTESCSQLAALEPGPAQATKLKAWGGQWGPIYSPSMWCPWECNPVVRATRSFILFQKNQTETTVWGWG